MIDALQEQGLQDHDNDANWGRLLKAAYVPCRPDSGFQSALLTQLKAKQRDMHSEDAIRTLLSSAYQPVEPRPEFETRLLRNLKTRQRDTVVIRRKTRRNTLFFSIASSAAAALVLFVVWVQPQTTADSSGAAPGIVSAHSGGVSLPLPETAMISPAAGTSGEIIPAAFEPGAGYSTQYSVASAFAGSALAASATALKNVAFRKKDEWEPADAANSIALTPGTSFRADAGMGHMEFPDGTLLSLSPDSQLEVTREGLSVNRGFVLVAVPEESDERFRLHFPERDIAIEPGTELAVMVEDPAHFADGGAPAPMVMVVARPGEDGAAGAGGLALAKGDNGVGPLFASQVYRLDRYVTPDLPGRTLCDAEYQDLKNLFKTETVRETLPMAAFAGGFSKHQDLSYTETVLSPAGFTKKGDAWIADSYNGEQTVKVKYLSDAYFGLANERRDLARSLALGSSVILDAGGDTFYEIHK